MQTKPFQEGGNVALNYLSELRKLRLKYLALAANEVYGVRLCRYCEHMKDQANGETGANALGAYCELDLVKQETGDLTAATCTKYRGPTRPNCKKCFAPMVHITRDKASGGSFYQCPNCGSVTRDQEAKV
jgi:hypothetical protein